MWYACLCLLIFSLHYRHLSSNYTFLLLIQQKFSYVSTNPSFINPVPIFIIFLWVMIWSTHNFKYEVYFQHVLQYLNKCHLFLCIQWKYLYPYNKILLFHHTFVLNNHTKTHALIFYLILILKVLNRMVYS